MEDVKQEEGDEETSQRLLPVSRPHQTMRTEAEALGGSGPSAVLQHLQELLGPLSGLSGELEERERVTSVRATVVM